MPILILQPPPEFLFFMHGLLQKTIPILPKQVWYKKNLHVISANPFQLFVQVRSGAVSDSNSLFLFILAFQIIHL